MRQVLRVILAAGLSVAAPEVDGQVSATRSIVTEGALAGGCLLRGGRAVFLSTRPRVLLLLQPRRAPALRLIGKGGSGPGEFDKPWAMSCFSDDSVAVLEMARLTGA